MLKVIQIIANKWWEIEPLVSVFRHATKQTSHSAAPNVYIIHKAENAEVARLVMNYGDFEIRFWCISDLIADESQRSVTKVKAEVLEKQFDFETAVAVIAFGTAATPNDSVRNGDVVIGSKTFVCSSASETSNGANHFTHPLINSLLQSKIQLDTLRSDNLNKSQISMRLLSPPVNASSSPCLWVGDEYAGVSVLNVDKSSDYSISDRFAYKRFESCNSDRLSCGSIETTHGLIRLLFGERFIFVSGIVNRMGCFPEEVLPHPYSQNFVAVHNASVALAWTLPEIIRGIDSSL